MKKILNKFKSVLKQFAPQIQTCKICFKTYKISSISQVLHKNSLICSKCNEEFKPYFHDFKIDGIKALSIYKYDEIIRKYLYQLKGCFDIEIAPIFLSNFSIFLWIKYFSYLIVPVPSYFKDDEIREFNHVQEIFKILRLKMINCLFKKDQYKQSDQSAKGRSEIKNHLFLKNGELLRNKKILIVDDVITTQNTIRRSIELIKKFEPKKIKILLMSENVYKKC